LDFDGQGAQMIEAEACEVAEALLWTEDCVQANKRMVACGVTHLTSGRENREDIHDTSRTQHNCSWAVTTIWPLDLWYWLEFQKFVVERNSENNANDALPAVLPLDLCFMDTRLFTASLVQ
jgi:hypothetical protein